MSSSTAAATDTRSSMQSSRMRVVALGPAITAAMVVELAQIVRLRLVQTQRTTKGRRVAPRDRRREQLRRAGYQLEARRAAARVWRRQTRAAAPDLACWADFDEA